MTVRSDKSKTPRWARELKNSGRVSIYHLEAGFLPLEETFVFALKALTDWTRPTHILEQSL